MGRSHGHAKPLRASALGRPLPLERPDSRETCTACGAASDYLTQWSGWLLCPACEARLVTFTRPGLYLLPPTPQ